MTQTRIRLNVIQEKFWMDDLLKFPSTEYNDPNFTFKIKGNLSLPVLKEAYRNIMVEYPPFCSTIEVDNGNPYFVPQENFELPFKFISVDDTADADYVEKMLSDLVNMPFDLSRELPCRFYCISKGSLYYLLHSFHHVVMDGMTIRTFFDRLTTIYNQLLDNRYVAANQREQLLQFNTMLDRQFKSNNTADAAYWKQYIEDVPVKVVLPQAVYDNTRTTNAPNTWRFRLGEEMNSKVSSLCKQCNTTHFRVYSAVWALTLSKVLNTSVIALDHALNMRPKGCPLFGVFVNNFPIKYPFSDFSDKTFTDLLEYSNANRLAEQQHIFANYGDYLPKANNAIRESFNFSINYPLKLDELTVDFKDCEVLDWRHVNTNVSAELLLVIDADKQLTCDLRYKQTISLEYVKMLAKTFGYILGQVVDNPNVMLSHIRLIDCQRQQELVNIEQANLLLASTQDPFPCMFKKRVSEYANHTAVVHQDEKITYSELDKRSDVLACKLHGMGIVRSNIGIALPKSIDMMVAILATLKSGNAYVPIDTAHPKERIAFIINDASLQLVFTHRETRDLFGNLPFLDPSVAELSGDDKHVSLPSVLPDDVAYIIYTSGTTGKPKGVPIRHSMLSQTIVNNIALQKMTHESRVIQFANIVFDASVVEIFPALAIGATLYLPMEEERIDINLLLNFLTRNKITLINIPPALLVTLPHIDLPYLKTIVVGGDLTNKNVIEFWSKDRLFVNAYGPTENCVDVTYNVVSPSSAVNDIGVNMPGVTCYVLDRNLQMLPDYAIGELFVGGVKLTSGYINREELNEKKFLANPFASEADLLSGTNNRIYRTGDLVMRRNDGHLLFLGRSDFQVKINGYRIELGEIETCIKTYGHGINDAVVLVNDDNVAKKLVAYVLTDNTSTFSDTSLRSYIKASLPSYMVPSVIVPLERFHYNSSGKVDRKRLPLPAVSKEKENYKIPSTVTEKRLAKIWGNLMGADFIGCDDSFMSLGGDSISVIKLVYELHSTFGINLCAADIYRNATLSELAFYIESVTDDTDAVVERQLLSVASEVLDNHDLTVDSDLFAEGISQESLVSFVNKAATRHNVFFTTYDVKATRSIAQLVSTIDRNLYFWSEGHYTGKPIILFINGFVDYYPYNEPVVTALEKHFSVFNIESFCNYFLNKSEISLEELLEVYEDIVTVALKDKTIFAVTGYCIGAELSIVLAEYLRKRHDGMSLQVLNIEGIYDRTLYNELNFGFDYSDNSMRPSIFNRLYDNMPPLNYEGPVVNIMVGQPMDLLPKDKEAFDEKEFKEKVYRAWKDNIENWKRHYPNAPLYFVDCSHMYFREEKNLNSFMQILRQCWKTE